MRSSFLRREKRARKQESSLRKTPSFLSLWRRSLRYEVLEDRRLLSVTMPLTQVQQNALVSGLQGLSQWAEQLAPYAQLGQQLPLVADSVGDVANAGTAIEGLHDQLANYFASHTSATPQERRHPCP